jgi:hypothetical protein
MSNICLTTLLLCVECASHAKPLGASLPNHKPVQPSRETQAILEATNPIIACMMTIVARALGVHDMSSQVHAF